MSMDGLKQESSHISRKRPRRRLLRKKVLERFEFLFDEPNLKRDNYLKKELSNNDGSVPLEEVLSFNSLKALPVDAEFAAHVLRDSSVICVTDDGRVCARSKLSQKQNSDECTCFVDNISHIHDVSWIIKLFSKFGKVDYVVFPKTKSRTMHRGYAFVEYNTAEAAQKACTYFTNNSSQSTSSANNNNSAPTQKRRRINSSCKIDVGSSLPGNHPEPAVSTNCPQLSNLASSCSSNINAKAKRKKRRRNKRPTKSIAKLEEVSRLIVLSFSKWKELKMQYKQTQKRNFSELKHSCQSLEASDDFRPQFSADRQLESQLPRINPKKKRLRGKDRVMNKAAFTQELLLKS